MEEPIHLQPYTPVWKKSFQHEKKILLQKLQNIIHTIEHVGSTAVPGLSAKPIIDMVIESQVYPPDQHVIKILVTIGYQHMGEGGVTGRHWFRKGTPRTHHIHWVPIGGIVGRNQISLRDWLRTHPEDAHKYERIKQQAAIGKTIDSAEYAHAKTEFILRVLTCANKQCFFTSES